MKRLFYLALRLLKELVIKDAGEPHLVIWGFILNGILGSHLIPSRLRTMGYKYLGINISLRALVRPGCIIRDSNLSVGSGSTINYNCVFDNRAGVHIGEKCGIGAEVMFLTTNHDYADSTKRAGDSLLAPVIIEDGVFVGSRAVFMPGVTVSQGVVVAAGSVVTRDCAPNGMYAGMPARRIREL